MANDPVLETPKGEKQQLVPKEAKSMEGDLCVKGVVVTISAAIISIPSALAARYTYQNNYHAGYLDGQQQAKNDVFSTGEYNNTHSFAEYAPEGFDGAGFFAGFGEAMSCFGLGYATTIAITRREWKIAGIASLMGISIIGAQGLTSFTNWYNVGRSAGEYQGYEAGWKYYCQEIPNHGCPTQNVSLNANDHQGPAHTNQAEVKVAVGVMTSVTGFFGGMAAAGISWLRESKQTSKSEEISQPPVASV
ncbi:MAG: hypothetical protein HWD59_12855 [Coxiellaceae bacterium]|nr:MAG: hypothetical protein HWD59_12855 [Coxiellaceae bacterium]